MGKDGAKRQDCQYKMDVPVCRGCASATGEPGCGPPTAEADPVTVHHCYCHASVPGPWQHLL